MRGVNVYLRSFGLQLDTHPQPHTHSAAAPCLFTPKFRKMNARRYPRTNAVSLGGLTPIAERVASMRYAKFPSYSRKSKP